MTKTKFPQVNTLVLQIKDFKKGLDAFTNQNVLDHQYSVDCYNLDFRSGALTEGLGFSNLTFPNSEEEGCQETVSQYSDAHNPTNYYKIAHYVDYSTDENKRTDKLILLTKENEFLFGRIISIYPTITRLCDVTFESKPKTCNLSIENYKYIFFFGTDQPLRAWDNHTYGTITYSNAPNITDFCMHNGCGVGIVGKERDNIRIDSLALNQWQGNTAFDGVNVLLDSDGGYANRLLSFRDYVFVLRDYGITRLAYNQSSKTYAVNNLLFSGSRIYGDTACICGDKGLVLCKDGIYEFDNISAKKIDLKINKFFKGETNKYAVATFKDGIYYLACRLNFGDGQRVGCEFGNYKNNALIAIDVATNEYYISRGLDINDLCTIQYKSCDKVLASFESNYNLSIAQIDNSGLHFGSVMSRFWKSPLSDIGYPDKQKLVKEISIFSKYKIKVTVFSEKESISFWVQGKESASKIPVRIRGNKIGISILSATPKVDISDLKITLDLLEESYA